jgi:hypothetical protein
MVETALEKRRPRVVRVVVSGRPAADDVVKFLEGQGATVDIDVVGDDIHVIAQLRTD